MKYLYTTPLPEAAQTSETNQLRQQLSQLGLLDQPGTAVENISSGGGDLTLEGQYRYGERVSEMLAAELRELSSAGTAGLPLYREDGRFADAGYYVIKSVDVDPVHANRREVYQFQISLVLEGTRADKFRAVRTGVSQEDHPFGNLTTAEVAAPAAATDVQWLNEETKETVDPTLVATRTAEGGDISVYDARAPTIDNPTLVYDLAYSQGSEYDVRVWDTRGNSSKLDADGLVTWEKCYSRSHDFAGEKVLDNGLVRLRFDAGGSGLSAERWDDGAGSWTSQSLGTSDWTLRSADIRHIGRARVDARAVFEDSTQSPTAVYPLDVSLKRGWVDPLWSEIDGEGGTPTGLVDLLDAVADEQIYSPGGTLGLVDREEVV